jgi:hypothetical protein
VTSIVYLLLRTAAPGPFTFGFRIKYQENAAQTCLTNPKKKAGQITVNDHGEHQGGGGAVAERRGQPAQKPGAVRPPRSVEVGEGRLVGAEGRSRDGAPAIDRRSRLCQV